MAILQRADGIQFAIRCYRETLSLSNGRTFRHEAFVNSDEHGYFVRFLPSKSPRTVEGVFSTDSGYLLAELIWNHFEKPANLIYCEKLADDQFLTVIVRDSLIYTDGNLNGAELAEELAFASHNMTTALVFLYGDIPGLTPNQNAAPAKDSSSLPLITFNARNVNVLSVSLFNQIQPLEIYLLAPVQQALSDLQLSKASKQKKIALMILFIIIVSAVGIYFLTDMWHEKAAQQQAQTQVPVDPLAGYKMALAAPSPQLYINAIVQNTDLLTSIPGWTFTTITVSGNSMNAEVSSYGGDAQTLLDWVRANHVTVKLGVSKATIYLGIPALPNRTTPANPPSMLKITGQFIDAIQAIFPNAKGQDVLQLSELASKGAYQTRDGTINFMNSSSQQLALIGTFLSSFPVTINSISLQGGSNMLLSGKINLTLYGA